MGRLEVTFLRPIFPKQEDKSDHHAAALVAAVAVAVAAALVAALGAALCSAWPQESSPLPFYVLLFLVISSPQKNR
jgi:hypothetical protein